MTATKRKPGGTKGARRKVGVTCGAKKVSGGKCTMAAGWGTNHYGYGKCKLHGGSTPTHSRLDVSEIGRAHV